MVGLATLTRSIGVRIPGGQPRHACDAVSVTGFESLGGNQDMLVMRYPSRGSNPWGATNEIICSGIRLRFSQPAVLPTHRYSLVVAAKLDMRAVAVAEF